VTLYAARAPTANQCREPLSGELQDAFLLIRLADIRILDFLAEWELI
jgi:hypothetical protein